jgi:hypothetical protein
VNNHYQRHFADPDSRPSNERLDPVIEHTRWRVEQLGRWLDEGAGRQVGPGYDPVLEALQHIRLIRRSDPGE